MPFWVNKEIKLDDVIAELNKKDEMRKYVVGDALVKKVFGDIPTGNESSEELLDSIILKVRLLDAFYSTNLDLHLKKGVITMASHIFDLMSTENLDEKMKAGCLDAVSLIAFLPIDDFIPKGTLNKRENSDEEEQLKEASLFSFASKYCCLSFCSWNGYDKADSGFYIYDSLVANVMRDFARNQGMGEFSISKLRKNYLLYVDICKEYQKLKNLNGSRRSFDWYVWGNEICKREKAIQQFGEMCEGKEQISITYSPKNINDYFGLDIGDKFDNFKKFKDLISKTAEGQIIEKVATKYHYKMKFSAEVLSLKKSD